MPYEWLQEAFRDVAAHGVEPYEVVQVLGYRRRLPKPHRHPTGGVPVLAIWGRTATGRPLAVFVRLLANREALILGARELSATEREELKSWESQ